MTEPLEARILLADDDEQYRGSCKRAFLRGYQVDEVSDADDLIAKATAGQYALIITDNQMEDGHVDENGMSNSGIYALRKIREVGVQTPILFWTGYLGTEAKIEAIAAGADHAVSKRAKREDLLAIIEQYTKR